MVWVSVHNLLQGFDDGGGTGEGVLCVATEVDVDCWAALEPFV